MRPEANRKNCSLGFLNKRKAVKKVLPLPFSLPSPSRDAASRPASQSVWFGAVGAGPCAVALAVLFVVATLYLDRQQSYAPVILRFIDTDDALRLAQVRTLLSGGGWFDPLIPSIGDGGLHSHWSRLLDLPIAGLILAARQFVEGDRAEQFALLLWPKLVLLAFAIPFLRQAARETGVEAAVALAFMLWLSFLALVQFQLMRIDHHNVQNACAALAIVLATSPLATGRSAFAAGLIAGLGLAIGYEALPIIGLLAALLAAASPLDDRRRLLAENFGTGLAIALTLALIATVRPIDWLSPPCDALGANVVAATVAGTAGLIAVGRFGGGPAVRLVALASVGMMAITIFLAMQPACIAGPFAMLDPAQGDLWLNHVSEAKALTTVAETDTAMAIAIGLPMLICLVAQAAIAWRSRALSEALRLVMLVALTVLGFRYQKMIPYAQLVGFYCLARAAFTLPMPHRELTPRVAAMLTLLLATPVPLWLGLSTMAPAAAKQEAEKGSHTCSADRDFGVLATMPSARILPQPDLGGYLALLAQHQVMIGNYHRLDREIMRAAAIFMAPPDKAKPLLDDWRIDIVVHCAGERIYPHIVGEGSLARAIEQGKDLPNWLVPIDLGVESGVRAWRVTRS